MGNHNLNRPMRVIGMKLVRGTGKELPSYPTEITMMVTMPTEGGMDRYMYIFVLLNENRKKGKLCANILEVTYSL